MPLLAGHILAGDQQLGNGMMVFAEELVIDVHQLALAYRGGGLLGGDILGPLPQPQLAHAHSNGPGGHQDHLMPRVLDVADHPAQRGYPPDIQVPCGMGQRGRADLYHNTQRNPSRKNIFCHYTPFLCGNKEEFFLFAGVERTRLLTQCQKCDKLSSRN